MLGFFIKYKQGLLTIFTIGIVGVLMASFGLEGVLRAFGNRPPIIEVGDEEVSLNQVANNYNQIASRYQSQFGEGFKNIKGMLNLPKQALDNSIEKVVIDKLAKGFSLKTDAQSLAATLGTIPYFKTNGLSKQSYANYLSLTGMSQAQFENQLRELFKNRILFSIAGDLAAPSEIEVKNKFLSEYSQYKFNYAQIKNIDVLKTIEVTEDQVKGYYESNKDNYKTERGIKFEFLPFLPNEYSKDVVIDDYDLKEYYETHKMSEFKESKSYDVESIYLKSDSKTAQTEALSDFLPSGKDDLSTAYKRLKDGEDFSVVASEYGSNRSGWIKLDDLSKEEKDAIKDLKPGQYSDVINLEDGYSIIKVIDTKSNQFKPFESVKNEIKLKIQSKDAPLYAKAAAEEFLEGFVSSGKTLSEYAEQNSKKAISATDKFYPEYQDINGGIQGLTKKAHSIAPGSSDIVQIFNQIYLVSVVDAEQPRVKTFEEAKEDVKADVKLELAETKRDEIAMEISNSKKSLEELVKEERYKDLVKIETLEEQPANSPISDILKSPIVKPKAFALRSIGEKSKPVFYNISKIVFELVSKKAPEDISFEDKRAQIRQQLITEAGQRNIGALVDVAKNSLDINIDKKINDYLSNLSN